MIANRIVKLVDLGRLSYGPALEIQRDYMKRRIAGETGDTLILVEHEPVITLGRSANPRHILSSAKYLAQKAVEVYEIERGGDVTYHGPGQQVGYPILNIRELGLTLGGYLRLLEDVMIAALGQFGLKGRRIEGLTGVFVGDAKVVAIGIAVKRWVTYHGFAFNVNPDMRHFGLIVPCGIPDHPVGSLSSALGIVKTLSDLRPYLLSAFEEVFSATLVS